MQKGKHKLYNAIVPQSVSSNGTQGQRNTGIDDRRDAMAHRYYFHATVSRLRYDDCLLNLQHEFFLQPDTIVKELQTRIDLLNILASNKTTTAELRRKYPFYNWLSKFV